MEQKIASEKPVCQSILQAICEVTRQSKDWKLESTLFDIAKEPIGRLARYFYVPPLQAVLLANIISINYEDEDADFRRLARHFNCNPLELVEMKAEFDVLEQKNYIVRVRTLKPRRIRFVNVSYQVCEPLTEAIIRERLFVPDEFLKSYNAKTYLTYLEEVRELVTDRFAEECSSAEMLLRMESVLANYKDVPLVQRLTDFSLDSLSLLILTRAIWQNISGRDKLDLRTVTDNFFENDTVGRIEFQQQLRAGVHPLQKLCLLSISAASFFGAVDFELGKTAMDILTELEIPFQPVSSLPGNIVYADKIKPKELYYGESEQKQLETLEHMLEQTHFENIRQRMERENMSMGVSVLLYGPPGTGKTETVYQLARKSNRNVLHLDISEAKSMWFGESEKRVKAIFTHYRDYAQSCRQMPILLINEADALLAQRKNSVNSSTDQTENTIQNILLEELESFNGILIATTNLAENFDAAFERRFLYKVKFGATTNQQRIAIWKSKLPAINDEVCTQLASTYNFSGAQIDNIVRKYYLHEIIYQISPTESDLMDFCRNELIGSKKRMSVGFGEKR